MKKKVKKYVWLGIAAATSNILFPMIIVAAILLPFTFAYQLIQEIGDRFENGLLQLKAETWDTFENALKGGDPGEQYEDYLISIYTKISKEIEKDKELEEGVYDQVAIGIGWVYSRIYGATMEASWFEATGNKLFSSGGLTTDRQGYVLHDESTTISTMYDPYVDSEPMDVKDIVYNQTNGNDVITPYDLQAFDYVGGTLFDMLELDVEGFKEQIKLDLKDEIDAEIEEKTKSIYADAIKDLTKQNCELIEYIFLTDTSNTQFKSAKTYLAEAKKDYEFSITADMSGVIKLLESSKYLSGTTVPLREKAYNSYRKIYNAGDTDSKRYENAEITKEDYANILEFSKNIEAYLENYIKGQLNLDDKSKKEIIKEMKKIVSEAKFGTIFTKTHALKINSIESDTGKKVAKKEAECTKTLTSEEFDERIKQKVKDLNLGRTWTVAETYMKELIALEAESSGFYYSFNVDSLKPILEAVKSGEIEKSGDSYILKDKNRFNNLSELTSYFGLTSTEFKTDATGSVIIAGVSNSGSNYLTGEITLLKDKIISSLKALKNEIPETIKSQLEEAKKNEEEMYKENMSNASSSLSGMVNKVETLNIANSIPNIKSTLGIEQIYNDAKNGTLTLDTVTRYEKVFKDKVSNLVGIDSFGLAITELSTFYANAKSIASNQWDTSKLESKYNELIQKLSEESQKTIQDLIDKYEGLPTEDDYYTNTEYYKESDISTIYSSGKAKDIQSIGSSKNELIIYRYKNTVKDAVINTAVKCYPEVIRELAAQNGGSVIGGISIIEGLEFGAQVGNESYNNAYRYIDLFKKYGEMYGVDPYLLLAKAAQESSGNHESSKGSNGYGLMQIEKPGSTITGVTAYNQITKQYDTMNIPDKSAVDSVEDNIRAGAMLLSSRAEANNYNVLIAAQAYNFGVGAFDWVLKLYSEATGKSIDAIKADTSDVGWVPYVMEVHINAKSYFTWTDNDNHRCDIEGCEAQGGTGHYGDPKYLSRILSYYNVTEGGGPWVMTTTGEKVGLKPSGVESTENLDGSETINIDSCFNGKELVNWIEYYTATKVFEQVDKDTEGKYSKNLSEIIIEKIRDYVSKPETVAEIRASISSEELMRLIGKTVYIESGFKVLPNTTEAMIGSGIPKIGAKYIKAINAMSTAEGKDLAFAVYLYCIDDDKFDMAVNEIRDYTDSFENFIKEKYLDDAESLTEANSLLTKVVQIITGNKDEKVDNYFKIETENDNSGNTMGIAVDGKELFYKEWLNAKNIFHELYNAQLDDEIEYQREEKNASESKIAKLEATRLPIVDINWENGVNSSNTQNSDGLLGKITLKENDEVKVDGVSVIKKQLTNTDNFAETGNNPQYIVIHQAENTSTGAKASQQYSVYNKKNKNNVHKSVHYSVDSREIYKFLNESQQAYHIGENTLGISNSNSIAVEYVASGDKISEKTMLNLVAVVKYLMEKYPDIKVINVMNHSSIDAAECPDLMLEDGQAKWNEFKSLIGNPNITIEYEGLSGLSGDVETLLEYAKTFLGTPYIWGGKDPSGFDCSGFTNWVFKNALGIDIGHGTGSQVGAGIPIPVGQEQPGDLIFFNGTSVPGHVGIYMGVNEEGKRMFIESGGGGESTTRPTPGAEVRINCLDTYYRPISVVRRVIN